MRNNLTKKNIINSIYMQIGFSKKISETLLEDIFQIILNNIIRMGRNPKTKISSIINQRKVVSFKASKEFKNYVNTDE